MIDKIIKILREDYSPWNHSRDPFRVMISCLLSLRTKDEVTDKAGERLFRIASKPEDILKLNVKEIEKAIYPVGFYRVKAKRIKEICKKLVENYNTKVPDDFDELLKFKGIGRKCAGIVMCYGFGKEAIPTDAHVNRISNRLGLVKTKNPRETEFALMKILDKKYWSEFNHLLVRHGQTICRPVSPFCSKCKIRKYCKRVGVLKSR